MSVEYPVTFKDNYSRDSDVTSGHVKKPLNLCLFLAFSFSPPQRPLSCCFDRKGFLIGRRPGERQKTAARRECREGENEKSPFSLPLFPARPPKPNVIKTSHREPLRRREAFSLFFSFMSFKNIIQSILSTKSFSN